jgi:Flp pilus assembly protein TadG
MRKSLGFLSLLGKLSKDEDGNVAIYFAILLPVTMGMIGLVIDGGAFFHLNNDLQELADAAAVAGAAELDGANDAITRATDRAANLLSNDPHWSNVARSGVQIIMPPTFYSSLNPDTRTLLPAQAKFIEVTTVTRERAVSFLAAVGATANAQTSASAVAGSSYVACNVQPLMICNPWEEQPDPVFEHHVSPGMIFQLLQEGGNSFAPGDFGLLDPAGASNSSANEIRNLLSEQVPNFCYVNNVSPRTGQVTNKVLDGINVRFNIPLSTGVGNAINPLDLRPAPNVIKGMLNSNVPSCPKNNWSQIPCDTLGTCALPSDDEQMSLVGSAKIGNGVMQQQDKDSYWNYHHGPNWPESIKTRYDAYMQEKPGAGANWVPGHEPSDPQCTPTTPGDYDTRRIISAAVVNCIANNVQGNSVTNLLASSYVDFFVTNPATSTVFLEFVRFVTPQSAGSKLHHVVQLYR